MDHIAVIDQCSGKIAGSPVVWWDARCPCGWWLSSYDQLWLEREARLHEAMNRPDQLEMGP